MSFVYAIMVLARTSVVAVIPILALNFLAQASHISALYLATSLVCLIFSIFLPKLISTFGLLQSLFLASLFGLLSAASFFANNAGFLFPGLLFQFMMLTVFESAINIYTTQLIPRRELSYFESRRVLFSGVSYLAGPLLGGWAIYMEATWIVLTISAVCAVAVPISLITLVPAAATLKQSAKLSTPSTKDVALFAAQPRLVLAWFLAVTRSSWWQIYGVYTPIFAVKAGLGSAAGGLIIAIGSAMLMLAPFWQVFSRKYGLRLTFFYGYLSCGLMTIAGGLLGKDYPLLSVALLVGGAVAISAVDSGGNAPFLRAVRPHQRIKMVPLYNTYRELAQIAPSAILAILLIYFSVSSVFTIAGLFLTGASFYCLKLNKRL